MLSSMLCCRRAEDVSPCQQSGKSGNPGGGPPYVFIAYHTSTIVYIGIIAYTHHGYITQRVGV